MTHTFSLRRATPQDLPAIFAIIRQAQAYMQKAGIPQWQDGYPDEATLLADIAQDASWLLLKGDVILGTAAMLHGAEPTYARIENGAWHTSGTPYATLHRIAIDNAAKGTGVAQEFYNMLEQGCRSAGAASIRVDTHRLNQAMQRFLAKCGYQYCGIIYMVDGSERLAYEKLL